MKSLKTYREIHTPSGVGRPVTSSHPHPIQRPCASFIEKAFTVAMLFYTTGAVLPLLIGTVDADATSQIRPLDLAIKAVLYAAVWFFILQRWDCIFLGLLTVKWILALCLVAVASTLWSQYPLLTLRGSSVLLAGTAFGGYFGICYTVQEQLRLLAVTSFLVLASSYFFAIVLPMHGIEQEANFGAWRGSFLFRNQLAQATVLAVFIFTFVRGGLSLRCIGIAASLIVLFLTGSATGIIVCFVIIVLLPLSRLTRVPFALVVPVSLGLGLLLLGLLVLSDINLADVLRLLDRSPDLTGRTDLWEAVLFSISKRPWLGYGFSAFWQGMSGESGSVLVDVGWTVGYAHNGFLDLLLHMGVLGLLIFLLGYLVVCWQALSVLSRTVHNEPVWLTTFLIFILLYNLTEGSIVAQNNIYWTLYISTAVSLRSLCKVDVVETQCALNNGSRRVPNGYRRR